MNPAGVLWVSNRNQDATIAPARNCSTWNILGTGPERISAWKQNNDMVGLVVVAIVPRSG